VVDFFDFSFFPAVFNVADSAITAGAVLLALGMKDAKTGAAGTL
jgi:lipoprotein signal peptidase